MSQKPVIHDIGPKPNAFDIENATKDNANYRTVAWSGKYLQVTLMSIEPGQSIGLEAHPDVVDPMHDDAGPHVFAGDVDEPGQRTGAEHGAALGDDLWRLGVVLHGAARGGRRCRSGYCLIIHVRAWWGVVKAMKNYGVEMGWGIGGRRLQPGPMAWCRRDPGVGWRPGGGGLGVSKAAGDRNAVAREGRGVRRRKG